MSAPGAGQVGRSNQVGATARASRLRLLADLRDMQQDPPEGCSASPYCEDSKF
jgi:ubiquitin-protein ligase